MKSINQEIKTEKDPIAGSSSELGSIRLHDNVISNLVRRAVLEVPGVSRLAGSSLVDNLAGIVGSRKMQDRAIAILKDDDDNGKVSIEIKLNIIFGFKIHEVGEAVQHAVIEQVEGTTNVAVASVNVLVQEVEEEQVKEEEEDTSDIELG